MAKWEMRNGETDHQIRLDHALLKLTYYLAIVDQHKANQTVIRKCSKWANRAAYEVFAMHPELREENSLIRYFVAREARHQGKRGTEVTAFVDDAFSSGTWHKFVPAEIIKKYINS